MKASKNLIADAYSKKPHHKWVKVFKNGPSKICGRQLLKDLKWYGLLRQTVKTDNVWQVSWIYLCIETFIKFSKTFQRRITKKGLVSQKQPPESVLHKTCSERNCKIHRKLLVMAFLFADCEFIKNGHHGSCFPVNYTKFFRTPLFQSTFKRMLQSFCFLFWKKCLVRDLWWKAQIICSDFLISLTYFVPLISLYAPWKENF